MAVLELARQDVGCYEAEQKLWSRPQSPADNMVEHEDSVFSEQNSLCEAHLKVGSCFAFLFIYSINNLPI